MRNAIVQAADVADMIELRLDCLLPEELQRVDELQPLLDELNLSLIVTLRPAGQGGTRKLDSETRNGSWFSWPQSPQVWRDMELDLVRRRHLSQAESNQLICSYHDFAGTPQDVEHAYKRLAATPARVLKLATQAYDVLDCLPLFKLLEQARQDQREIIAIAMGPSGLATRILGPSRGAFLTFAALDQESSTATGQLTVSELRDLYGIDRINLETQISGLIGFPIDHSVSPEIHNAALQRADVNGVYLPFPVRDVDLDRFLKRMVHPSTREIDWNIRGLSVTAPHKSSVMSSLDWIEPTAAELGAINTIVVEGNQLHGYNTDILGFVQTLVARFGELQDAKCAVIGAGGAARAVVWGLKQGATNVTVFGRDEVQTKTLAQQLEVDRRSLTGATFHDFDVVINATNLGTAGELVSQTPANAEQLTGARLACDLVYNPQETLFLSEARAAGCETLGGLPMLVRQAAQQFKLWTAKDAPEQVMLQAAAAALQKNRSN